MPGSSLFMRDACCDLPFLFLAGSESCRGRRQRHWSPWRPLLSPCPASTSWSGPMAAQSPEDPWRQRAREASKTKEKKKRERNQTNTNKKQTNKTKKPNTNKKQTNKIKTNANKKQTNTLQTNNFSAVPPYCALYKIFCSTSYLSGSCIVQHQQQQNLFID